MKSVNICMSDLVRQIYRNRTNIRKQVRAVYRWCLGSEVEMGKLVYRATLCGSQERHEAMVRALLAGTE